MDRHHSKVRVLKAPNPSASLAIWNRSDSKTMIHLAALLPKYKAIDLTR